MIPARTRGSITLELVIAFAIFSLTLTSVALLEYAGAPGEEREELMLAQNALAGLSEEDFGSIESTTTEAGVAGVAYTTALSIADFSPCVKRARVSVTDPRSRSSVTLAMLVADFDSARALGGDCETFTDPEIVALAPAENAPLSSPATALDALGGFAYIGLSSPPYFAIADVRSAGTPRMLTIGDFSLPAAPDDLDSAEIGGHRYIFAALATSSNQLAVVEADDSASPHLVALRPLAGVDPSGDAPQGYRIRYYGGNLYLTTRYTAGPELHIFDARDPSAPVELGNGTELGITVNDLAVRDEDGRRLLYAVGQSRATLLIYDATDPYGVVKAASAVLPDGSTAHEGESLALLGDTLLAGRVSTPSGSDVFAYDARDVTPMGDADIGTGALEIVSSDSAAFLATPKSGKELQVWNTSDPAHITLVADAPVPKLSARGIDYAEGMLYAAGAALNVYAP